MTGLRGNLAALGLPHDYLWASDQDIRAFFLLLIVVHGVGVATCVVIRRSNGVPVSRRELLGRVLFPTFLQRL